MGNRQDKKKYNGLGLGIERYSIQDNEQCQGSGKFNWVL